MQPLDSLPGCKRSFAFVAFICLLTVLTLLAVVFFCLAIWDTIFVYVGVGCLGAILLLVSCYTAYRYCVRRKAIGQRAAAGHYAVPQNGPAAPPPGGATNVVATTATNYATMTDAQRSAIYRRLEHKINHLYRVVGELRVAAPDNVEALDLEYENITRQYARLTQWIEGVKTPSERDVTLLRRALRTTRNNLQIIRNTT